MGRVRGAAVGMEDMATRTSELPRRALMIISVANSIPVQRDPTGCRDLWRTAQPAVDVPDWGAEPRARHQRKKRVAQPAMEKGIAPEDLPPSRLESASLDELIAFPQALHELGISRKS